MMAAAATRAGMGMKVTLHGIRRSLPVGAFRSSEGGLGAGLGAIIGGIAGGGSGAAIGALAGGAAGTALAASGKPQLKIPSETRLQFQLMSDLKIQ